MTPSVLSADSGDYPDAVRQLFEKRPPSITALGDFKLLQSRPRAILCSIKCPGDVIVRTYDLIRALRDAGIPAIGGFHSPMEKECLAILLRGAQPVIICLARTLQGLRMPAAWKQPLAQGRLLILSPFEKKQRRTTADAAKVRNALVAALADEVVIAYAGPGSKTEAFCQELVSRGKSVWAVASEENRHLLAFGIKPLQPSDVHPRHASTQADRYSKE